MSVSRRRQRVLGEADLSNEQASSEGGATRRLFNLERDIIIMNAYSLLFSAALAAGAAIAPTVASAATNTFVNAKINGDDQFKVHLSTLPTESGFQYVNGYGWSVTYPGKMLMPTDTAQNRWQEYWVNVFVEDIGGFGPDLLGQFTLTRRANVPDPSVRGLDPGAKAAGLPRHDRGSVPLPAPGRRSPFSAGPSAASF
jgi:hypothetical protein